MLLLILLSVVTLTNASGDSKTDNTAVNDDLINLYKNRNYNRLDRAVEEAGFAFQAPSVLPRISFWRGLTLQSLRLKLQLLLRSRKIMRLNKLLSIMNDTTGISIPGNFRWKLTRIAALSRFIRLLNLVNPRAATAGHLFRLTGNPLPLAV